MKDEYIIKTLESKVEKLQEDLRNKQISIKNCKARCGFYNQIDKR